MGDAPKDRQHEQDRKAAAAEDAYAGDNLGAFFSTMAINPANWTRSYSKSGWIDTLPPRDNLHILANAAVTRIVFADNLQNGLSQVFPLL